MLRRISCCPHAVVNTPAGPRDGVARHVAWWQPSPFSRRAAPALRVSRPARRSLRVTACWLAESLNDPFHRKLRPLRYLHSRFGCYRLERPVAGWELHPLKIHAFARRTRKPTVRNVWERHLAWILVSKALSERKSGRVSLSHYQSRFSGSVVCYRGPCSTRRQESWCSLEVGNRLKLRFATSWFDA